MLSKVYSGALMGIDAWPVTVEVDPGEHGEPAPVVVGMATTAVKESKDRVWAAIGNSAFELPHKRTVINLAPGHLPRIAFDGYSTFTSTGNQVSHEPSVT